MKSPEAPIYDLRVGRQQLKLSDGYRSLIRRVTLDRTVDGAAVLSLECSAWDPIASKYRILGESIFFPGSIVTLHAGYGPFARTLMGHFQVLRRRKSYSTDGPTVTIECYDALQKLMRHTDSRLWQGVLSDSQCVYTIANENGLLPDVVDTPPNLVGYDRFKEAGMTDLAFLKIMSQANGYQYPQVRPALDPKAIGSVDENQALVPIGSVDEMMTDRLIFRPIDLYEQQAVAKTLSFMPADESEAGILSAEFDEDLADVPTAVEVVGTDDNGQIVAVVAEYTPMGITTKVDYSMGPAYASVVPKVKSGESLALSILGEGVQDIATGQTVSIETLKGKTLKVQSERQFRDIIDTQIVKSKATAEAYARAWLEARVKGYMQGSIQLANTPGCEDFDVSQVHELRGFAPEDNGKYITTGVSHEWSDSGHAVSLHVQRLIEV